MHYRVKYIKKQIKYMQTDCKQGRTRKSFLKPSWSKIKVRLAIDFQGLELAHFLNLAMGCCFDKFDR